MIDVSDSIDDIDNPTLEQQSSLMHSHIASQIKYHEWKKNKTLYYCPKCFHGFTLKSNRNRHLKFECGQEPRYSCPYCELRSKQTSQIYSHIRKKHPGQRVYYNKATL